jgi:uncharacterized protein (TIGR02996 family)
MSDDAAFLRAIKATPDDPSCRLGYADWLEEQGDPRSEYLRLGCRLAQLRERIDPGWLAAVREGRFQAERVQLQSGRLVALRELRQFRVYEGLLEGLPRTELNQRIINGILEEERTRLSTGEPYLIRPDETPIQSQRPIENRWKGPHLWGQPAALPSVGCVGRFHSSHPARDSGRHFSELVVVWFQEDFALPIDQKAWAQLLVLDWERYAADYNY